MKVNTPDPTHMHSVTATGRVMGHYQGELITVQGEDTNADTQGNAKAVK